eukprot:CAMPEP_0198269204 /NCGR_PEP_ID=MMETSP1447-20131203/40438_1 /TAXON_ID=420782 /ORGANISM="Chaetoceros dichaeta, Strain CCMP1751" /LENGTH=250 /DNA_ID=CAMNT_0043960697 /DNA_START=114 /DNA_END=863 /DNA_ORIENTATION=-
MREKLLSDGGGKTIITLKVKPNQRSRNEPDPQQSPLPLDVCVEYSDAMRDGPMPLRALAFFGGFSMITGSVVDIIEKENENYGVPLLFLVVSIYTWFFGLFIITMEGRPFHLEVPHFHRVILNHFEILRFTWGRGLFYLFSGSIQFCLLTTWNMICGGYMILLGFLAIYVGRRAHKKMDVMCKNIANNDTIRTKFYAYDKDRDGFLNVQEFKEFTESMDIDLSYDDFVATFTVIDSDADKKISLKDFQKW